MYRKDSRPIYMYRKSYNRPPPPCIIRFCDILRFVKFRKCHIVQQIEVYSFRFIDLPFLYCASWYNDLHIVQFYWITKLLWVLRKLHYIVWSFPKGWLSYVNRYLNQMFFYRVFVISKTFSHLILMESHFEKFVYYMDGKDYN